MPLQLSALRDALLAAGVPPDKAGKAAEEVAGFAGYESRFGGVERRLDKVEADLMVLKWMAGFNLAMTAGVVLIKLTHG